MREVTVESIRSAGPLGEAVMILREKGPEERRIPIWIGALEAYSISIALEQIPFPRPLTHDLFLITLTRLATTIKSVTITGLALNTFFAKIEMAQDKQSMEIDARPSDAVALALRAGAPIFASDELFELGTLIPPDAPPEPPPPPAEHS
jgi:hypothetical protein